MNRRDIIIVAVIINAGLLVTLFISSLKNEGKVEVAHVVPPKKEVEVIPPVVPKGGDQIDQVISQYTAMAKIDDKKEEIIPPLPVLTPRIHEEEKVLLKIPEKKTQKKVTVEKGDVLEKIARTHGVSVDEIMKINNLSNSRLQIGQELFLPEKKAPFKKEIIKDDDKYYIVKGGDNPWTIAQKNNMQVEELLRLNNMDAEKAKKLRPGDRLKIK